MISTTKSRAELKAYFVKNAIPTESQFAELIEGSFNKKDDGLIKIQGDPLSLEAGEDDKNSKPLIHFYSGFNNQTPDWFLNLNPRTDPNDETTAKPGLNFSDNNGTSRLFIANGSGNIGIGTIEPTHTFHVKTGDAVGLFESTGTQAYLRLATNEGMGNRVELANRPGGRLSLWTAGGKDVLNITRGGDVGIGVTEPQSKLQIVGGTDAELNGGGFLIIGSLTQANIAIDNNEIIARNNGSESTLHMQANGGDIYIHSKQAGTEFVVKDNGNVGIGTNSPSAKLHVTGGTTYLQQQDWQSVSFTNGWGNYGSSYNTAGYFKDSQGIVHLKGLVKGGTIGGSSTIFTLPVGYRPAKRELQIVASHPNGSVGRCDILSNGQVLAYHGNSGWFSLDGITFKADTTAIFIGTFGTGSIINTIP